MIFHDRAATPRALYEAQLVDGRLSRAILPQGDATTPSPERLRLIAARDTAVRAVTAAAIRPCPTSFNTVVLPANAGEPIRVYFLQTQTKADDAVIGGHYRVDIGADGKAGTPFAFSKGCMTMNRPPKEAPSPMMFVTTLTDSIPNETHVFTANSYRVPLVVGVPGKTIRMFAIMPGRPIVEMPSRR